MPVTIAQVRALFFTVDPEADSTYSTYEQDAEINTSNVALLTLNWIRIFVSQRDDTALRRGMNAFFDALVAGDEEEPCLFDIFLDTLANNHEIKCLLKLHSNLEDPKLGSFTEIDICKTKVRKKLHGYVLNAVQEGDIHRIILQILLEPMLKKIALENYSATLVFDGHKFISLNDLSAKLGEFCVAELCTGEDSEEVYKLIEEIVITMLKNDEDISAVIDYLTENYAWETYNPVEGLRSFEANLLIQINSLNQEKADKNYSQPLTFSKASPSTYETGTELDSEVGFNLAPKIN